MEEKNKFLSPKVIFISVFSFLVFLNLLFLDFYLLSNQKAQILEKILPDPTVLPQKETAVSGNICPQTCLSEIFEATRSYKPLISDLNETPTLALSVSYQTPVSSVKEFFIPFGNGTNYSDDWEDVAGLKASVDTANYSSIKSAVFEASVHIPTGNQTAYVRLFNETDKHPVWFSDVSLEGGTAQLLVSKPITLDSGNKTYKVQMKTSLKYQAVLNQARIRITTN